LGFHWIKLDLGAVHCQEASESHVFHSYISFSICDYAPLGVYYLRGKRLANVHISVASVPYDIVECWNLEVPVFLLVVPLLSQILQSHSVQIFAHQSHQLVNWN
jgi:hypothetical protein